MNFYLWLLDNRNKNKKLSKLADYMETLVTRAGLTRMHRLGENGLDFWKNLVKDLDAELTKDVESSLVSAYKVFSNDQSDSEDASTTKTDDGGPILDDDESE